MGSLRKIRNADSGSSRGSRIVRREDAGGGRGTSARVICTEFAGKFATQTREVRGKMRRISAFYVLGTLNTARQYVNIQHFGELYVLKGLF